MRRWGCEKFTGVQGKAGQVLRREIQQVLLRHKMRCIRHRKYPKNIIRAHKSTQGKYNRLPLLTALQEGKYSQWVSADVWVFFLATAFTATSLQCHYQPDQADLQHPPRER